MAYTALFFRNLVDRIDNKLGYRGPTESHVPAEAHDLPKKDLRHFFRVLAAQLRVNYEVSDNYFKGSPTQVLVELAELGAVVMELKGDCMVGGAAFDRFLNKQRSSDGGVEVVLLLLVDYDPEEDPEVAGVIGRHNVHPDDVGDPVAVSYYLYRAARMVQDEALEQGVCPSSFSLGVSLIPASP
jgi:hypothetical protein